MITVIKMNGKKISQKKAIELIGKERFMTRLNSVKDDVKSGNYDSYEVPHWMDGMSIQIFEIQNI